MAFCAICTDELPPGHVRLAPLGRNDAMVNVCDDCFDERPVATSDDRAAYVPPDAAIGPSGAIRDLFSKGAERVIPYAKVLAEQNRRVTNSPMYFGVEDGHILVRVPRRDGTRRRDNNDAFAYASKLYPGVPLRLVGQTARFILFQRPDPAIVEKTKQQREDHRDPLASLHAMQRHGARR